MLWNLKKSRGFSYTWNKQLFKRAVWHHWLPTAHNNTPTIFLFCRIHNAYRGPYVIAHTIRRVKYLVINCTFIQGILFHTRINWFDTSTSVQNNSRIVSNGIDCKRKLNQLLVVRISEMFGVIYFTRTLLFLRSLSHSFSKCRCTHSNRDRERDKREIDCEIIEVLDDSNKIPSH